MYQLFKRCYVHHRYLNCPSGIISTNTYNKVSNKNRQCIVENDCHLVKSGNIQKQGISSIWKKTIDINIDEFGSSSKELCHSKVQTCTSYPGNDTTWNSKLSRLKYSLAQAIKINQAFILKNILICTTDLKFLSLNA